MIKARSIHPQRLVEPTEFYQERITQVGGLSRYGEPMFKIAWAQSYTVRQGGQWEAEGETFTGYKDVLLGDGHPLDASSVVRRRYEPIHAGTAPRRTV